MSNTRTENQQVMVVSGERGHPPPPPCGGRLARFNTPVGLRPTCGRDARAPRNPSARRLSPGARASCPLQLTGGPAAHCGRVARAPGDHRSARRLPWDRGRLARFNTPVGLPPTCGRDARAPRNPSARRLPWDRGRLARFNTPVGLPPTCGRDARAPRNPSARRFPRDRGHLARFNSPAGLRPTCGRDARDPRNPSARRFPRDRGRLARFNTPVGLPPTCGRDARAPRNPSARRLSPGPRASCPLQHTGGPSAHLRAGRLRSQEPLRSALSPGPRASCPLQLTGGPPAHLRARRPRSQEPLRSAPFPGIAGILPASTHRWAFGPPAGGTPALPGTPPLSAFPGRGHLARLNNCEPSASVHSWTLGGSSVHGPSANVLSRTFGPGGQACPRMGEAGEARAPGKDTTCLVGPRRRLAGIVSRITGHTRPSYCHRRRQWSIRGRIRAHQTLLSRSRRPAARDRARHRRRCGAA